MLPHGSNGTPTNLTQSEALWRHAYRKWLNKNFWNRWTKEYLLQLRSAHFSRARPNKEVKAEDIIIVHDEKLARQMWKLGRVLEVYRGADDHVHSRTTARKCYHKADTKTLFARAERVTWRPGVCLVKHSAMFYRGRRSASFDEQICAHRNW